MPHGGKRKKNHSTIEIFLPMYTGGPKQHVEQLFMSKNYVILLFFLISYGQRNMGCCCVRVRKRGHLVCMYVVASLVEVRRRKRIKTDDWPRKLMLFKYLSLIFLNSIPCELSIHRCRAFLSAALRPVAPQFRAGCG